MVGVPNYGRLSPLPRVRRAGMVSGVGYAGCTAGELLGRLDHVGQNPVARRKVATEIDTALKKSRYCYKKRRLS